MSNPIEDRSLLNQIHELRMKFDKDKNISYLNSKIGDLSKYIINYLSENLDEVFIIKKGKVEEISKIEKALDELIKTIESYNSQDKHDLECRNHLIKNCLKIEGLIREALKTEKYPSPFTTKNNPDYYVHISKFIKSKDVWRDTLFQERINWEAVRVDPKKHPEWVSFSSNMKRYITDDTVIEEMWKLTIAGIDYQLELNQAGKTREANPHFSKLADLLNRHGLLSENPGEPFALWSGGYDMSLYAQFKNYTTLEKTKAGAIFNGLMLYTSWSPLGPLWNNLSNSFAKNAGNEVHVFYRVQDPLSVLERHELRELATSSAKKIVFHPFINLAYDMDALEPHELMIKPGENPSLVLKDALASISQKAMKLDVGAKNLYEANLTAIKTMKID